MIEKATVPISTHTFLHNLRTNTSQLHQSLEKLPLSQKLTAKDLSVKDYIEYLMLMKEVISYTEKNIFPFVANVITDINERRKLPLIESDLQYFNAPVNLISDFNYETSSEVNEAFALGIMYVIEGSSLGGRVLFKNAATILNVTEEKGGSYFAGYQSKTGSMWKMFLDKLCEYEQKTNNEVEIINGANVAFKSIYNFMNKADIK